jgi:hypothetical protein
MEEPKPANIYQSLVIGQLKNLRFEYSDQPMIDNVPPGTLRYKPTVETIEMLTKLYRDGKGQGLLVAPSGALFF